MKFTWKGTLSPEEIRALQEVMTEADHEICPDGFPVTFEKCEKGVHLVGTAEGATLKYENRNALMRGAGLLCRYAGKTADIKQTAAYDILGTMPDVSRNAVMTVDAVKRLCRLTALMGFNAVMLYTEDVYEIEDEPFFGHLRGRYSTKDLREMDDYAALLGIEMIPCIQTLAHLAPLFQWPDYNGMRDWDDILNVSHERVYELIERMIAAMSKNLRSRRINIGMDEAFILGRGKYLQKMGYRPSRDIMLEHLGKVVEICNKYGQSPRMWSDMFFRMGSPDHTYRHPDCKITEEIKAIVPKEVTLVYWDYYSVDKAKYDRQYSNHKKFNNPIAFAGGDSGWYGVVPLNQFSVTAARAALQCAREQASKEVYVTMWRSPNFVCSHFAVLPTLVLYGEDCWSGDTGDENLREAMLAATGCDYDAFCNMEQIENYPGRLDYGTVRMNASSYLCWQDALHGKFDAHVPEGIGKHFAACRKKLLAEKNGKFDYVFDTLAAFCHVLELKAEMGANLKKAYDSGDRQTLAKYRDEIIPELICRVDAYRDAMTRQWRRENRMFGFDLQDIAFGGLRNRISTAKMLLDDYLKGEIAAIEELEAPRLPVEPPHPKHGILTRKDFWKDIVTTGVLSF